VSAHPPPIPPDQQPPHGGGHPEKPGNAGAPASGSADPNLAEQGSAGNLKQNTTNKGLQQDR